MDWKIFAVVLFAIAGSWLMLSLPLAAATDVSIMFNGMPEASAQISPGNIVNKQVTVSHDESDISWADTKILVRVNTASLAYSIKKIYLYKCKKLDPNACMQTPPMTFDNWVDVDLAWSDISEQAGQASYPQAANILVLVKLEGTNSRVSWMAFWDTVKRLDYNIFNEYSNELNSMEVHAKTADLVGPIQAYIGNFQMVPFNWVSKVVFGAASVLYGGKGSEADLDRAQPNLETLQAANQVTALNKDFGFIFSNISGGIANAITLNLNPSFTCGDNKCDSDLGETPSSCCYDCGCLAGSYCDISSGTSGSCKVSNQTTLAVAGYTVPTPLQQCSGPVSVNVSVRINNPPSSLPATLNGIFKINSTQYNVACTGSNGAYNCPLLLQAPVSCGFGSFSAGPNTLNISISYKDGPDTAFKDLSAQFYSINVNYDCGCQNNYYCDIGPHICRSEGSIMLQVLSVDSYLNNFVGSDDVVKSVLRIVNAPTNFTANTFTFNFGNITWTSGSVQASHPTVNCISAGVSGGSYTYNCSPVLTVPDYSPNNSYVVRSNSVSSSIVYTDGGIQKQSILTAPFGDITIPQQSCGNGRVDPRETMSNCCRDFVAAGQSCGNGQFCDIQNGCRYVANITASAVSVDPSEISDCTIPHSISITTRINNAPSDGQLNFYSYLQNNVVKGWALSCSQPAYMTGIVTCNLIMPPGNCSMPFSTITGNSLDFLMSFKNGGSEVLSKELSVPFGDLRVTPAWHCGDHVCESGVGESAANCCIDCSCKASSSFGSDYYCNYDQTVAANGTCEAKSNIRLVIDRPTSTVNLKSCEGSGTVNIKAHLENQPATMTLENFFGTLNGDSAEMFCEQGSILPSSTYIGGWSCVGTTYSGMWSCIGTNCSQYTSQAACANFAGCSWSQSNAANSCSQYTNQQACSSNSGCTWQPVTSLTNSLNLNCTMFVPAESECIQGKTYRYTNNSIGIFVSYRDGLGGVVTQNLVHSIADITVTQTYRSIYQITNDAVNKIRANMQKMLKVVKTLLDYMKLCIYIQITMVLVEITATVYLGTSGAKSSSTGFWDFSHWSGTEAAKNIGAVGAIGTALNTGIGSICNMITTYFKTVEETISIQNEIIKMDVCIAVYQHQLDAGMCASGGISSMQSCTNGLTGCVNMGAINSYFSSMQTDMNQISGYSTQFTTSLTAAGTAIGNLGLGGGGGLAALTIGGTLIRPATTKISDKTTIEACDRYPTGTSGSANNIIVSVIPGTGCSTPMIIRTDTSTQYASGATIDISGQGGTQYHFVLYCFANNQDYLSARNDQTQMTSHQRDEAYVNVTSAPYNGANCWGSGTGGSNAALTSSFLGDQQRLIGIINTDIQNVNTGVSATGGRDGASKNLVTATTNVQNAINNLANKAQAISFTKTATDYLLQAENNFTLTGVSQDEQSRIAGFKSRIETIKGQLTQAITNTP